MGLTAARCVAGVKHDKILVEIDEFARAHIVEKRIIHKRFMSESGRILARHDIAMLRLRDNSILEEHEFPPLCDSKQDIGTQLIAIGMGNTEREEYAFPDSPMQAFFREVGYMATKNRFKFTRCPDGLVCTQPRTPGASIDFIDEGGPLYALRCSEGTYNYCLYGIASFYRKHEAKRSMNRSFFTSVPDHYAWIMSIINHFKDS